MLHPLHPPQKTASPWSPVTACQLLLVSPALRKLAGLTKNNFMFLLQYRSQPPGADGANLASLVEELSGPVLLNESVDTRSLVFCPDVDDMHVQTIL